MSFNQKLNSVIRKKKHFLCIGLDPDPDKLPIHLQNGSNAILKFLELIISNTKDLVVAYKANEAFFQSAGFKGYSALDYLKTYIPDDIIYILDGKKGDIGNTAKKYATAAFNQLGADAVTINPYMGYDAVKPFIEHAEDGAFVLTLTSNNSARDFQYLYDKETPLYLTVAKKVNDWNKKNNCGLVVGATKPQEMAEVRKLNPDLPFLVPGVGAQGGDLKKVIENGRDRYGTGLLINIGRDIIYTDNSEKFIDKLRQKAEFYISEMQKYW